jgi:hypothetical protein
VTDAHAAAEEARVTVVYCGGCNPHIDRSAVAAALPLDDPALASQAIVRLSGCARACASAQQVSGGPAAATGAGAVGPDGVRTVIVAGESVDGVPTAAAHIAAVVTRKLKE